MASISKIAFPAPFIDVRHFSIWGWEWEERGGCQKSWDFFASPDIADWVCMSSGEMCVGARPSQAGVLVKLVVNVFSEQLPAAPVSPDARGAGWASVGPCVLLCL